MSVGRQIGLIGAFGSATERRLEPEKVEITWKDN